MSSKIVVVGSTNTDMVIKADHLPKPGETILGGTFFMNPGGKGANQAVAAARLGSNVTFISKIGNDIFGRQAIQLFEEEGINTSYIFSDPNNPSGVALITIDNQAENCIVVASGANALLHPKDIVKAMPAIEEASFVLMQLEIPIDTVEFITDMAIRSKMRIILNPAPAPTKALSDNLMKNLYIITPNRVEAEMLTGIKVNDIDSAKLAAKALQDKGVKIVIITLGEQGALVLDNNVFIEIPAEKVTAVDTTAAGDVFNAALAVALSEGRYIVDAVKYANKAASIAVTRLGAQSSAPYKSEVILLANVEK